MSEKIYLKVPSKPTANEVSHGNHSAVLTPGKVITVEDRKFADWIVREFACAEVDPEVSRKDAETAKEEEAQTEDKKIGGKK